MTVATYPNYSASTTSTWVLGAYDATVDAGVYRGLDGTGERWRVHSTPLQLQPGLYYLNKIEMVIALASSTHCDKIYFGILEGDTDAVAFSTLSNGLTYFDITSSRVDTTDTQLLSHDLGDVPFTIEAGKSYWFAVGLHGTAGRTTAYPGYKILNATMGPQGGYWEGGKAVGSVMTNWDGAEMEYITAPVTRDELARMNLTFKTSVRKIYSGAYSAADTVLVPRRSDGDYWIKFQDAVVADGQAFTCLLNKDAAGDDSTKTTLALDMGATDQMTFGGANVALAAAGAEAGDTFELGVNVRPGTGKMDLFYQNQTTGQGAQGALDLVTISHACKNGSARAASYTIASPSWLKMSGTAAVDAIQVGWEPVVLFGDSQTALLGLALASAFTHERMYLRADISGNQLTTTSAGNHTAGYLRYKHTTPGLGDLCEMTGIVFAYCGYGLNDVSSGKADTAAERNGLVMLMATRVAEILDDLQDRSNHALVIGLPPWTDAVETNIHEALTIKQQVNPMLEGLAVGCRAAYVNPWWAMVAPGTSEDAIPSFATGFCDAGHTHYNATGAALVGEMAARAYETGILGGWWSNPARRWARSHGLLMP